MEIIEVTSTSFPDAVELPNKAARPVNGHNKASSSNAGTAHKSAIAKVTPAQRKRDQEITAENKMMLVIDGTGKRRWVRMNQLSR